jgi:hypothetical protein
MRVGYIVAFEDSPQALAAAPCNEQEGETKYILGPIPSVALKALGLTYGMTMAVRADGH